MLSGWWLKLRDRTTGPLSGSGRAPDEVGFQGCWPSYMNFQQHPKLGQYLDKRYQDVENGLKYRVGHFNILNQICLLLFIPSDHILHISSPTAAAC